jgi:hypothetical protein
MFKDTLLWFSLLVMINSKIQPLELIVCLQSMGHKLLLQMTYDLLWTKSFSQLLGDQSALVSIVWHFRFSLYVDHLLLHASIFKAFELDSAQFEIGGRWYGCHQFAFIHLMHLI